MRDCVPLQPEAEVSLRENQQFIQNKNVLLLKSKWIPRASHPKKHLIEYIDFQTWLHIGITFEVSLPEFLI